MDIVSVILPSIRTEHMGELLERLRTADEILYWYGKGDVVYKSNKLVRLSDATVFICINDRTLLVPGWREILNRYLSENPHVEVFSFTETSNSQFAVRAGFLKESYNGDMFYPGYCHYHPDQEIGEIARRKLIYKEIPGMIEKIYDKTESTVVDPSYDKELYDLRERYSFP